MATVEVWFRNPHNYIKELVEVGTARIAWDRGAAISRRIDPVKHAGLYFGTKPWRVLLIGPQGTAEYTSESVDVPVGVYPTWDAETESLELLEEMMCYPIGEDPDACNDETVPLDERPVTGQDHRVVVTNLPKMTTTRSRAIVRQLKELQEAYPSCILHIHNLYGYRVMFGMGFSSVDCDPRTGAGKGKVMLPSGKEVFAEKTVTMQQWVTMIGMTCFEIMKEPRNRCIYNIKSALWAAENYLENIAFAAKSMHNADMPDITSKQVATPETKSKSHTSTHIEAKPADKINCDSCSLQNSCKYYRVGSVCSVPGSEPASLASHFKTRDADLIIDGLGTLLALQARRLDRGISDENLYGELDPEVTKIANQVFTNGSKLAKLVDPQRFAGPKVQVNVGGGANGFQASSPNQVMASIVNALEARGIKRENITPEMVQNLLAEMSGASKAPEAIQGVVLSEGQRD